MAENSSITQAHQLLLVDCQCGHKGTASLKHYELARCKCGKFYWALQPKRFGPLVIYPWPGENRRN